MSCDNIILIVVIILCFFYGALISYFTIGWFLLKEFKNTDNSEFSKVSLIISARNEEENIQNLLDCLFLQDYPVKFFEVIILDDASTDETVLKVKQFISSNPKTINIKLIEANENDALGKKAMISKGIAIATGSLIITTDADCQMNEKWISSIVSFYQKNKSRLIIGPVSFNENKTFFSKIQDLEFLSLIATSAGSARLNCPIMCNGANLIFEKSLFDELLPFSKNINIASGDDQFLLIETKKRFPESISFLKSNEAMVYTNSQKNISGFVNQRIRWVSKSAFYKDAWLYFVSLIVFLFNFITIASFVISVFYTNLIFYSLILLGFKIIIDFPILLGITSFIGKKKTMVYYLPTQIFVIIYTSFIGFAGNLIKVKWKGRKI